MARPLVPDDLWTAVALLLPPARPKLQGGRPPIPDRAALTGIIFVLKTGIPWEGLPAEMGCGSGMTCWRRLCSTDVSFVTGHVLNVDGGFQAAGVLYDPAEGA